jgi:hypothetical protein
MRKHLIGCFFALLLTTFGLNVNSLATKVTKTNGEVVTGESVGFIVLQAEPSETANTPAYLLCPGKHVSSVSQKGVICDENAALLLRVIEKPSGQSHMAVLEDAAGVKDRQLHVFVVPNGTKAFVSRPHANFDATQFRLLGTLELRNGLATLVAYLVVRAGKENSYIPIQEIDPAFSPSQVQPDARIALLTSAKRVFVTSSGHTAPSGAGGFLTKMATKKYNYADAESAKRDVVKAINGTKRWTVADSADKADLVISIDEVNSSAGNSITDRLWVFKGGSVPDRSSTQPLWFCVLQQSGRSASRAASLLEEDMKNLANLDSQKIATVMPLDAPIQNASVSAETTTKSPSAPAVEDHQTTEKAQVEVAPAAEKRPDVSESSSQSAYQERTGPPTDVNAYLLSSKTVFVRGQLGHVERATRGYLDPNSARAADSVTKALAKWGRYEIVNEPARADLIAVVTESNRAIWGVQEQLRSNLSVYAAGFASADSKPLWTSDAKEAFTKMPSTKVAEDFCKYVDKLQR